MDPALAIASLWLAFAVTHMAFSSLQLRPKLVGVLGEPGFAGFYSLVALAIFVPLVMVYWGHKHEGPMLYAPLRSGVWWAIQYALMGIAFLLLVGGLVNQSPAAMKMPAADGAEGAPHPPSGVQLITRHAVFMAIGLFGVAHLMVNPFATDVAFFAGFPIFAVADAVHQDSRKRVTMGDSYRAHCDATPLLPFVGPVSSTLRGLREIPIWVYVLAVGVTVGLRTYHTTLFG